MESEKWRWGSQQPQGWWWWWSCLLSSFSCCCSCSSCFRRFVVAHAPSLVAFRYLVFFPVVFSFFPSDCCFSGVLFYQSSVQAAESGLGRLPFGERVSWTPFFVPTVSFWSEIWRDSTYGKSSLFSYFPDFCFFFCRLWIMNLELCLRWKFLVLGNPFHTIQCVWRLFWHQDVTMNNHSPLILITISQWVITCSFISLR